MASELKSAAARIKGAKSRGPKTPEGLRKSSRNALKHGFTSLSNILLDCENPEEFQSNLDGYLAIYQPTNPFEKGLVEEIVATRWRIRRLWAVETSLLNGEILNNQRVSKTFITGNPTHSLFSSEPALQIPLPFLNPAWRQGPVFHEASTVCYT